MPYYYDLRIVRWLAGRTRRKKLEQLSRQRLIRARPRYSLASLMCLDRSHILDETLRNAVWYQAGLPREIALEILQQEEVGAFVVRDSTTHPGCYALSVRVPKFENASGISHYLILRTQRGVKLKGLDKEWSTLAALVTHHTVMREMLPCTLRLPKVKASATANASVSSSPSHAPSSSSSISPKHASAPISCSSPSLLAMSPPPSAPRQDVRYTRTTVTANTAVNHSGVGSGHAHHTTAQTAISSNSTTVVHTREQFHVGGGGTGGGVMRERETRVGGFREREAGVMYTDNYSHLSEVADLMGQLNL